MRAGRQRIEQGSRLGVVGLAFERNVQFMGCAGTVASSGERDGQIEVIIGFAGIVLMAFSKYAADFF